jgi:DNA-binding response OmpR family regulator
MAVNVDVDHLRGQLIVLVHRDSMTRRRLAFELIRLGYSVLPLLDEEELSDYLDRSGSSHARAAFPDLVVADELTLGLAGMRRLAARQERAHLLPVVLLSDAAVTSVTDEDVRGSLQLVAVLHRPYTRHQLALIVTQALPSPYTDEAPLRW